MTRVLLIFLDGIGLGDDDPAINPFAAAHTPTLNELAGARWLRDTPVTTTGARVHPTDRALGVPASRRAPAARRHPNWGQRPALIASTTPAPNPASPAPRARNNPPPLSARDPRRAPPR